MLLCILLNDENKELLELLHNVLMKDDGGLAIVFLLMFQTISTYDVKVKYLTNSCSTIEFFLQRNLINMSILIINKTYKGFNVRR